MKPIVIVGTGLAGYMLAKELRKIDASTPLVMITSREGHFYSKPQLSTAMSHERHPHELITTSVEDMRTQLNATILTQTHVTDIDAQAKTVTCDNTVIEYSKLVLAVGADTVNPPLQGNAANDVLSVNDLEDYDLFRQEISDKKRVTILGAGLVGCEFANDLSNAGYQVSVIAPATHPVDRLVPELVGFEIQKALEANGVQWYLNTLPLAINKIETTYSVTLNSGGSVESDVVMSAIGIRPRKSLAEAAGLRVNRGVLVNRRLQTSNPDIFALGDCAEVNGVLLFFVAPLLQCARTLAKTLSGQETRVDYPAMPVVLKTPACPCVVQPPAQDVEGEWHFERDDDGLKATFIDAKQQVQGFVLTHKKIRERASLSKDIPAIFSGDDQEISV